MRLANLKRMVEEGRRDVGNGMESDTMLTAGQIILLRWGEEGVDSAIANSRATCSLSAVQLLFGDD